MPITFGAPTPPAPTAPAPDAAPVVVEIRWTDREGARLTGLLTLANLTPADRATVAATDREDQWLITGGTRRATLDGMNDYTAESHHFHRLTPDAAARQVADWLGLTGRPVRPVIVHEYRDGA